MQASTRHQRGRNPALSPGSRRASQIRPAPRSGVGGRKQTERGAARPLKMVVGCGLRRPAMYNEGGPSLRIAAPPSASASEDLALNGICAPFGSDPPREADVPRRIRHTPFAHRFPARACAPACAEGFGEDALPCEGGDKSGGEGGREGDECQCFYHHATWSNDHFDVGAAVKNVVEAARSLCREEESGEMT